VAWRVTSGDGHPVTGTFRFTAEAAGAGQVPPPFSTNQSGGGSARSELVLVVALLLAVGIGALLWRRMRRKLGDSSP
jgi:copper resistance protein C